VPSTTLATARFRVLQPLALILLIASFLFGGMSAAFAAPSAAIVIDGGTGRVLYAESADAPRYPASLTKMLTLYIAFEEIAKGRLSYDTKLKVSAVAAKQAPTKLGLRAGATIKLGDAMRAVAVRSANDMAVVIAEHISGSVPAFAERMNATARRLGMKSSTFRNPNGLPNPAQVTTARDMAILGRALYAHYPKASALFATRTFRYGKRSMRNTNKLLGAVKGVEGIKTGYTRASGYNLVTSVRRDGKHIIAVVLGGKSGKARNARMTKLITAYLPKAGRGGGAPALVADVVAPTEAEAVTTTTVAVAMPRLRPGNAPLVAAAAPIGRRPAAAPVEEAAFVAPEDSAAIAYAEDPIAARIQAATAMAEVASARWNGKPRPAAGEAPVLVAAAPQAPAPAGWHVQIGAYPSQDAAHAMLENARAKAGGKLKSAKAFTQATAKEGVTLYRARFAGFKSKNEARGICRLLQKKSFSCMAVTN